MGKGGWNEKIKSKTRVDTAIHEPPENHEDIDPPTSTPCAWTRALFTGVQRNATKPADKGEKVGGKRGKSHRENTHHFNTVIIVYSIPETAVSQTIAQHAKSTESRF